MTVTGQPASSLLDSIANAQTTRTNIDVSMLKNAQDVEKQEGAAMVDMIEQSAPQPQGPLLDVYA